MYNIKKRYQQRFFLITLLYILILPCLSFTVFAEGETQAAANSNGPWQTELNTTKIAKGGDAPDKDTTANTLGQMFGTDVWSGTNVAAGVGLAQPLVRIIMTLCIAVVVIVAFLFFGVTALDLAYITVPILRPVLMKGKESMGGNSGGKFVCISDSAVEAVEGKGGGGMGGGDRGVSSCLVKYVSSRTVEFVAFIVFIVLFFSGILGNLVIVLFNLFYSVVQALLSLA